MDNIYIDESQYIEDKTWNPNPQFGWEHKYWFSDREIDNERPLDSGISDVQDSSPADAAPDDFSGYLSEDSRSYNPIRDNERNKPFFRSDLDDVDLYAYHNSGLRKLAHIRGGDYILIMRPTRYSLPNTMTDRLAKVCENLHNGWLIVENMRRTKLAVYVGSTDEDDDVQKVDFDFLSSRFQKQAGKQNRAKRVLRRFFIPDEGRDIDLAQNISEEP